MEGAEKRVGNGDLCGSPKGNFRAKKRCDLRLENDQKWAKIALSRGGDSFCVSRGLDDALVFAILAGERAAVVAFLRLTRKKVKKLWCKNFFHIN